MSEDEKSQKDMKKQEEQDASKKALKTGAKAAANAYLGPVGGKAVDLASKTKLGDTVLNTGAKALNKQNPMMGKIMNAANKTGALDAADKAVDATSGNLDSLESQLPLMASQGLNSNTTPTSSDDTTNDDDTSNQNSNSSNFFNNDDSNQSDNNSDRLKSFFKKHKYKLIGIAVSFFLLIVIVIVIIAAVYSVGDVFNNFINGIKDLFTSDQQELEEEYYEELQQTQKEIHDDYGICIDTNLITASLIVNTTFDGVLDNGNVDEEDEVDNKNYDSSDSDSKETTTVSYKKMKKQINLLANMQIKNNKYSYDKEYKATNGDYCKDNQETVLVTNENQTSFERGFFSWLTTDSNLDSSTPELIASHDVANVAKFFTKKSSEEKNYAYYLYYPAVNYVQKTDISGNPVKDASGNPIMIRKCSSSKSDLPEDTKEISIGSLSNMEDSVFYWNLVNSFIPDYYDEYLPSDDGTDKRLTAIKKIAEDIYLLYQDMGPSQSCSMSYNFICRSDEGSNYYSGETSGSSSATRTEFMNNISPVAISEMTRTGVYASVTMAQAALESANGGSGLSTKYANYYGMTAGTCAPKATPSGASGTVYRSGEGGNTCSGNSFWDGTVVAMCNSSGKDCQWYRVYDSFENSTRDHSRLLADRYGCNVYGSNKEQLQCIKDHGYATDPNYVSKILNVIKTYNLSQYDIGTWDGTTTSYDSPTYNNQICYNGGATNSGTFTSWKQYDKAWSNVKLGPSNVGTIGCAMTSISIQIMRSGSPVSIEDFNPGTFAQALSKVGAFDSKGNITWAAVERVAPNFKFVERGSKINLQQLNQFVSEGYYVILNVKYGRHWVAVDSVDLSNNKIYMFDPGSPGTEVGETYGLNSIMGYALYRRV